MSGTDWNLLCHVWVSNPFGPGVFFLGPFLPAVVLGPGLGLSLVFIETVKSCMTTQRTLAASTGHARFGFSA